MINKLILVLLLSLTFLGENYAQDIIVTQNNSRITTRVIRVTDSIISCRSLGNKLDTTFFLRTSDLKMIIYEIGNIQYFDKKVNDKNSINVLPDYIKQKKKENLTDIYKYSLDIGTGITAGFLNGGISDNYFPFQINLRSTFKTSPYSSVQLGANFNYTNLALVSVARRYSVHGIVQAILFKTEQTFIYCNALGGFAYFEPYTSQYNYVETNKWTPSVHLGLGVKHYIKNETYGWFIESGLGGPYLINTGIFFY